MPEPDPCATSKNAATSHARKRHTAVSGSTAVSQHTAGPRRSVLAAAAATTIVLGLAVHFLLTGAAAGLLADALYTVLVYLALAFVATRLRRTRAAAAALALSAAVELFQLSGLPERLGQAFPASRLLLGTTFSTLDLLAYAAGAAAALVADAAISRQARTWGRSQLE
ncbi:DUF2809 domain-containing protein [Arthrobacter livingstonensis]|nr:DUF2809 domain-containing protein [Arthrobacter livingstonensis]